MERAECAAGACGAASRGWAVDSGGVLVTADGGVTWSPQSTGSSLWLWAVSFPDVSHGWAVGSSGLIATTDGGVTWNAQITGVTDALYGVDFTDAAHGWAVGNQATILAITDGGATWKRQNSPIWDHFNCVAFPDARHGWAAGDYGNIVATANGGATWSTQYPKSPAPQIAKLKPAFAKRGALITINGTGFGAAQGSSSVKFGNKACTVFTAWSETRIKCRVPAKASVGAAKVTVATPAGTSNSVVFRVKR